MRGALVFLQFGNGFVIYDFHTSETQSKRQSLDDAAGSTFLQEKNRNKTLIVL